MNASDFADRLKNTGRNDPCPCGSGKKYKKCHLAEDEAAEYTVLKKAEDEREAALAAEEKAEGEEKPEGEGSGKGRKKEAKPRDPHPSAGKARNSQTPPSNIPRRGAV